MDTDFFLSVRVIFWSFLGRVYTFIDARCNVMCTSGHVVFSFLYLQRYLEPNFIDTACHCRLADLEELLVRSVSLLAKFFRTKMCVHEHG